MMNNKKVDFRANNIKLELEQGQKLIVTHKGSAWFIILEVDAYDDICIKKKSNYRTPIHLKPIKEEAQDKGSSTQEAQDIPA